MNRFNLSISLLLFGLLFFQRFVSAQNTPLLFIQNEGQWQDDFLYKGVASYADIYLENTEITYVVGASDNAEKMEAYKESAVAPVEPITLKYHAYKMKWVGANLNAKAIPSKKQAYYLNYYLGNNPDNWHSKVGVYGNVDYQNLYPGINVHISSDKGHAKYDFIVMPNSNPADIQLAFEGQDGLQLKKGNLNIETSVGAIVEMSPFAYQFINGEQKIVVCNYRLSPKGILSFSFPNGYDNKVNLIIDPTIIFATLTGSAADNWGFTATYDKQGNLYAGGIANGLGYPTTLGAFQITFGGGSTGSSMPCDISISKFNSTGTTLLYSTYLGGNKDEMPHSLVVDSSGNLIVVGKTLSTNFPTTVSAFDGTANGGYDILISKFNASGTALLGSTYVGGSNDDGVNISSSFYGNQNTIKYNYGDGSRSEVIIDRSNNIYIASSTQSTNFPITSSAAKSSIGGTQDALFLKFNSTLGSMIYGTYLGGSDDDAAYVLTLDTAQTHVYVGGGTSSNDFQSSIMSGAYQSSFQGGISDGFICRFLNSSSYSLQKGTYIGTAVYDQVYGLETDLENGVYAMGQTLGAFPVSSGVYSNAGSPQFLIKLDSNLTSSIYSTVFGSGISTKPNISPVAFLVDTCQNVYISGWGGYISTGSSTLGLPITANAFQSTTDGSDFYFIVLSQDASSLLFASFFGSPGKAEHVDGGTSRFDPNGIVYQAICASCGSGSAFPATAGAYATQKGSTNCNLGAVKIAFNLGSVNAIAGAIPSTTGCAPFQVSFTNNSTNATSFSWDFGDGSSGSTANTPSHLFTGAGTYTVRLIASNPNGCKTSDTAFVTIIVSSDTMNVDFNLTLSDTCTDPKVTFQNTSTPMLGHTLANADFTWYFGDGSSYFGQTPPIHPYPTPGTYEVLLIMEDNDACNSPDSLIKVFQFSQIDVLAAFDIPDTICSGTEITFLNSSQNATDYNWDFGDSQTATIQNPSHVFQTPGTYTIRLRASNPNACNKEDSIAHTITVSQSPTASFSYTPLQPKLNVPYTFYNESQNANHYSWDFGDGHSSTDVNPIYQYDRTGQYTVCLTAYNLAGCQDKYCKSIRTEVQPLADLPSAFSPNGDGENDILYVRGYSIESMDLKIFNRWGEMVFQSTNINNGWDGTYKNQPQEMEVYAFSLEVTFYDGTTVRKQGNVTLLR